MRRLQAARDARERWWHEHRGDQLQGWLLEVAELRAQIEAIEAERGAGLIGLIPLGASAPPAWAHQRIQDLKRLIASRNLTLEQIEDLADRVEQHLRGHGPPVPDWEVALASEQLRPTLPRRVLRHLNRDRGTSLYRFKPRQWEAIGGAFRQIGYDGEVAESITQWIEQLDDGGIIRLARAMRRRWSERGIPLD
jgi:hypothetical protein